MDLQRIGRYDIKSLIGQGGMSAVYLGYDPRSQREVAIKILPPYYLHAAKFRERFEREALMIALLEHPAIVPVYDMGEEDGQPYIVMRYMSGGSLSDKLKRGFIPLRECMEMYLRLAPALDTAHARGVTHRDVKPDNLLFDKYDNVFLSDFGLARLRETIGFANISDGSVMGTPAYMSPEQIQGDREIDGRSDIYSMGVVLYQMLCGEVPFYGTTAASVMMMHLVNPVPQIHDQNKSLPIGIQTVLDTAMAKNPNDRYQTAGEFARAIQAVTTGVHKRPTFENIRPTTTRRSAARPAAISPSENPPVSTHSGKRAAAKPSPSIKTPLPGENNGISKPVAPLAENVQPEARNSHAPPTPRQNTLQKRSHKFPLWGYWLGAFIILVVAMAIVLRSLNAFPFSLIANSNIPQNNAAVQNSPTAQTSHTAASSLQASVVLGQADKLAFLKSSDIWTSNLDGSDLIQLTTDGNEKSNLHWSPDGQSVVYTSSNCIKLVGLLTRQAITLTCFSGISSINAFDISADGQNAAIGLAQSDLYLLPYTQLFSLGQASLPSELFSHAQCPYYAPYQTGDMIKAVNWSSSDGHLAVLHSKLVQGTYRDEVSILDFSQCTASPRLVEEILPTYFLFTFRGYYDHPEISSLSWNGNRQLLLGGYITSQGFGDLQLYNLDKDQGQEIAPNGSCCYRDVHWSPDGTYLFYAFQPESGGDISLYYTPTAELNQSGSAMASLTLPEGFLSGDLASFQPTLRTVH
ncbi:MAG: protein kinase [Anaerolineales bacterium]